MQNQEKIQIFLYLYLIIPPILHVTVFRLLYKKSIIGASSLSVVVNWGFTVLHTIFVVEPLYLQLKKEIAIYAPSYIISNDDITEAAISLGWLYPLILVAVYFFITKIIACFISSYNSRSKSAY
ncbi:MAG: hypothetical protein D6B27_07290 [Gammaproteobacteria bacterium]|nr:MAG: hypothetical protein D6B27_07290 [Gammaproteobacteria bacterium]